ncbi:PREDICTED: F-box/LRR-repeat protein 13-like [Priapulus caudatus]|uniref:F-box/LRR-repeat protein 13-like n=1 Tax=Priapulus caudatus TaxID=37621 RepID=A0ABM1EVB2_PRICU|nr:PREDICTED: F-box/LRR-repeat protein 13-like [Priapulus caudatus]
MAPSLRWSDPKIKCYFEKHDVPGLFESLLTALLVMCPPDPERFVSDCLQHLLLTHTTHVSPDYFIAEDIKRSATKKQVTIADDEDVPTPEMLVLAYTFLNKLYLSRTFRAWRTYTVTQKAWKKACCKVPSFMQASVESNGCSIFSTVDQMGEVSTEKKER